MKLFLTGFARSGKDYAAEYLRDKINLSFSASSYFCAKLFIFAALKDKYGYSDIEECFEDRHNHRKEWADMITAYNKEDPTRLASQIFDTNDVYVGIRRYEELQAAKERWPELLVIWIDAEGRVPAESTESCTIAIEQADIIIRNRGSLPEYNRKLRKLSKLLEGKNTLQPVQGDY